MTGPVTDTLAWAVVAVFAGVALLERRDADRARPLAAFGWALFGVFWVLLFPHFAFEQQSFWEGGLALLALPACLSTGYLLYRGRDSLFVLSRAVAVMGLIYLPFQTIPSVAVAGVVIPAPRQVAIEVVTRQTEFLVNAMGYDTTVVTESQKWPEYRNTFVFYEGDHRITFRIVLACTGLGSITIFAGLIAAVKAPLRRKLRATAIAVPIIYALNLVRTTFITVAFGEQKLHVFADEVMWLFGESDPYMVSFLVSDRIVSQTLSLVVIPAVAWLVVREVPELLTVIEDVLYVLTRTEYDLRSALGVQPARADGGGSDGAE